MSETSVEKKPARRPRDRKDQILAASHDLFRSRGFDAVSMEDIAAAVGITAGALYHHYSSKQHVLGVAVTAATAEIEEIAEAADDLPDVVRGALQQVLQRRGTGLLFQTEARNLLPEDRTELNRRLRAVGAHVGGLVATRRPDLPAADVDLLAWATITVATSPLHHRTRLGRARVEDLMLRAAERLWSTRQLPDGPTSPPVIESSDEPATRRQALLLAGNRLFQEHGYQNVTMEQLANAAGITAASVYNHFSGKQEILRACLTNGSEELRQAHVRATTRADDPAGALAETVRSYVDVALSRSSLTGLSTREVRQVPDDVLREMLRRQRDYLSGWVSLLPGESTECWFLVHAAVALVTDISLTASLRSRPSVASDVAALALDVLGVPAPPPSVPTTS